MADKVMLNKKKMADKGRPVKKMENKGISFKTKRADKGMENKNKNAD